MDEKFAPLARIKASTIAWDEVPASPGGWHEQGDGAPVWNEPTKATRVPRIDVAANPSLAPFLIKETGIHSIKDGVLKLHNVIPPGDKRHRMLLTYKYDPKTKDFVLSEQPKVKYDKPTGAKETLKAIAPLVLMAFPGVGTALGSAIGLSGTAASMAGNALISSGLAGLGGARGSDLFKAGIAGGISGGLGSYGAAAGWNPALTRAVSGVTSSAIRGGDPRTALVTAIIGRGGLSLGNSGLDALLRNVIGSQMGPKRKG